MMEIQGLKQDESRFISEKYRPKPLEDVFNRSFDPTGAPATFKSLDESAKVRSTLFPIP